MPGPYQAGKQTSARYMPNWLARRAADTPHSAAIIVGDRQWTFAALDAEARALAEQLATLGAGEDTRIGVLLRNGPHFVRAVHALTRLAAIAIPLNLRLTAPEIAWQLEYAHVNLLIHDQDTATLAVAVARERPSLSLVQIDRTPIGQVAQSPPSGPGRDHSPHAASDSGGRSPTGMTAVLHTHIDLAATHCIMYTSGTTGRPKGVMLTYGNHWWSAIGSALNLGLHADDRWLACLPLFHIGGLSILLRSVIYGIPVVFPDPPGTSFDPTLVNQTIAQHRVTIISVVSAQLQRMVDAGLGLDRLPTSEPIQPTPIRETPTPSPVADTGLRCVLLGGGPAPRPLLEECAQRSIPVVQSYGLTETCSQVATLAPADALPKLGSAGRPLLPTELRIDAEVDRSTAEEFPTGEILVRGPTVTPGYLPPDDDGDNAVPRIATDAEGWLHTGDVGYLDGEGYLYVLDRRDDLIISGGENVYPAEVEAALLAYPAIAEAGVYGLPDPTWGQVVAAAVVLRPGASIDEEDLLAFCRARLARYKVPAHLHIVEALPRNAAGKLLRRELRR